MLAIPVLLIVMSGSHNVDNNKPVQCPFSNGATSNKSKCPVQHHLNGNGNISNRSAPVKPYNWVNPYANARPLTPEEINVIKATVPVLKVHGLTITRHFYKRIFSKHPELNNIFNQAHQATDNQPRSLASAVYAYAANIDNLSVLGSAVNRIAHKHASLNIQAEQYPIVGENLLASIKEVLGDAATDEILSAWAVAYAQLANILIGAEKSLYDNSLTSKGGWNGWRNFKITKRIQESDEITSFYLSPIDIENGLPKFKPGQYISIRKYLSDYGYYQPRQYSLSQYPDNNNNANNNYFRISVKKEYGGKISNLLHNQLKEGDNIEVSMPYGDYYLDKIESKEPIVLISGGVGETPHLSILDSIIINNIKRPITFIHSVKNSSKFAMKKYLKHITKQNNNIKTIIFYTGENLNKEEQEEEDYNYKGRINLNNIQNNLYLNNKNTEYFICGPIGFATDYKNKLIELGVQNNQIHDEVFGSAV